ncbi:FG-GAP and VCBS repeat-containing protein [Kineosporia sp. NBRC 101731]|uniref:FG-GAP and VCBS repeat-containing protein n=1 Tax=Kineosporia sp. NBRC 101731 TaxID=3032199 RepID=UPI0024A17ECB|nr:FG-GAP and VCBS repeat-containing protein [Kineosporia sp. NBRC 101731]GLY30422.1 hypothetical protein Kisp02_37870 [Kineosporia sp. NBRC 101731]
MSRKTGFRPLGIAGLTAALAIGTAAAAPAAFAAPITCGEEDRAFSWGDVDGDGSSDVLIGVPNVGEGSGAVDVRGTSTPWQRLTSSALGGDQDDNDQVGTAIAVGDLDDDGCADLVVGAPGEGGGTPHRYSGQVHIVFGSPKGIDTSTAFVIPTTAAGFDRFGAALALQQARGNDHDLYVGAPEATVGGKKSAGEVYRYTITPGGSGGRVTVTAREVRSQNSAGVPGAAEAGDRFGSVLSSVDNGLGALVGVPEENVGTAKDSGSVWHLRVNAAGNPISSYSWSQNSPGVAGTATAGDRFGASVSSRGNVAAIGVPGEDVAGRNNAGAVQTLVQKADVFTPQRFVTQNTAGVPGGAEAGDQFGAEVVAGAALICQEETDLAIGSPGEDVGSRKDAGSITLVNETRLGACASKVVRQGSGLAGAAETGDQVGSVLGITRGMDGLDEDYSDRLLVGVPYEDIGAVPDAGLVQPLKGGIRVNGQLVAALKYPTGYLNGNFYGWSLSTSSD